MEDGLPERRVSLIKHRGGINSDEHDGNSGLLCICLQWDDTVEKVNSTLLEIAANNCAETMHEATNEILTLVEFQQAEASDPECQAAAHTLRFFALHFPYDLDNFLVRQIPVDKALRKYV